MSDDDWLVLLEEDEEEPSKGGGGLTPFQGLLFFLLWCLILWLIYR